MTLDVDGDGTNDRVEWTCGESFELRVGERRVTGERRVSELMGCTVAFFSRPRPTNDTPPRPGVAFCLEEHEEAGPPFCFLYAIEPSSLRPIWSGSGALRFDRTGTIASETVTCREDLDALEHQTVLLVPVDDRYEEREQRRLEPLAGATCAEP